MREITADFLIAVRGNGSDLRDLRVAGDLARILLEILHHGIDGEIDAALQVHGVHTGSNRLGAFLDNGLGEHSCGRRAIASEIVGFRGDLAQHLRAHVLELVLKLDFLGD